MSGFQKALAVSRLVLLKDQSQAGHFWSQSLEQVSQGFPVCALLPAHRVRVQCELFEWGQLSRGVMSVPEGLHGHRVWAT